MFKKTSFKQTWGTAVRQQQIIPANALFFYKEDKKDLPTSIFVFWQQSVYD